MAPRTDRLDAASTAPGFRAAPHAARLAMLAGSVVSMHLDPFDRVIAATAPETATPRRFGEARRLEASYPHIRRG
jgi:PIN domain nuclease of toxin-antitoxin system